MQITFALDDAVHVTLCKYIPHGMRKHLYRALITGLARELERDAKAILLLLLESRLPDGTFDVRPLITAGVSDGLTFEHSDASLPFARIVDNSHSGNSQAPPGPERI